MGRSFNHFAQIGNDAHANGEQLVQAYAAFWQSAAAQLAPVATMESSGYIGGDLRGSVGHELQGPHDAKVFATMEYAVHQEYGTVDMPAQPFMRPARNALVDAWKRDLKKVFGE